MTLVRAFSLRPAPALAEVGGKGLSLIRMTHAGIAIPPGFVLTVGFFEPWVEILHGLPEWSAFTEALGGADLEARCDALKARCADLTFSVEQVQLLEAALEAFGSDALFAVRSSSPEEDLDGSSFAGGYETVLGVTRAKLEAATRRAFASCLDARVAVYKKEHGFDAAEPRIAVVVQEQIASEIAGVGFSLDPVSNAYDEAVFNANWGLGETVVAGLASPDLFTVDKPGRKVLRREIGKKETSIWLTPGGGTEERADPRHDEPTLGDEQVLALTDQLVRIEALYGVPMDIEWAFAGGRLYLLQARPITTHLALPEGMVTAPGAPKRLYWDVTISVQGFFEPLSAMGMDCWRATIGAGTRTVFGRDFLADAEHAPVRIENGRLYVELSNVLAFVEKEKLVGFLPNIDPVAAATLAAIDAGEYRAKDARKPVPWNLILHAPEHVAQLFEARVLPDQARRGLDGAVNAARREMLVEAARPGPFADFARAVVGRVARTMFGEVLPLFVASKVAMSKIRGIFEDATAEEKALLSKLDQSLPRNVTIEMGLALADLAAHVPPGLDLDALEAGVKDASIAPDFLAGWTDFLGRYGHRGPAEIDVATPRYREQPRVLLSQLVSLSRATDPGSSPQAVYERSQRERHEAFERLAEVAHRKGWLASKRLHSLYRMVEELGGARETPKFCLVLGIDLVRARALREADALVAAGRLDARDDVFHLGFDELDRGLDDARFDLRAVVRQRKDARARLMRFRELPRMIDSRGRILRPPTPPLAPGELAGFPISAGVVRGAVKVLHSPAEKPLLPGEILVARATDPGWTPLFVNAAAVVLEVGGLMQHGALVAREYGKPCVAGVEAATRRLTDGEIVEVDGAAGVVRRISPPP